MGLVAFSPIDALFTPPGEGAGKHGGSHGLPDKFTDLLAALLGNADGEPADVAADQTASQESADSLLALLAAGRSKGDDENKGMPAMAALLASLLHPAATPVDLSISAKDANQAAAPAAVAAAVSDAATVTAAAALVAGDAPETPAVDAAPAPAVDTPLQPAADATAPDALATVTAADTAMAQDAPAVPASATVVEATSATPTTEETTTIPATGQVDSPPPDDEPADVKANDGPDPAEPPATETIQQGVVRFVGNAHKGKHEGQQDGQQDGPGLPEHERGMPRASAQGIAHASGNSAVAQLRTPAPDTPPVDQVAPPPPPAEQSPAVEQVVSTVIEKVEEGGGEARIRLDPPELGEVTIHVKISGDHVRVDVHAERAETMQMLRDHALDLTSLLNGRGLDLTDVYVGLGGRQAPDTRDDEQANARSRQGQGDEFANLLGIDDEPPAADRFNRLRSAYNPDGAHVYRI